MIFGVPESFWLRLGESQPSPVNLIRVMPA